MLACTGHISFYWQTLLQFVCRETVVDSLHLILPHMGLVTLILVCQVLAELKVVCAVLLGDCATVIAS
jgi:hypothetical protein